MPVSTRPVYRFSQAFDAEPSPRHGSAHALVVVSVDCRATATQLTAMVTDLINNWAVNKTQTDKVLKRGGDDHDGLASGSSSAEAGCIHRCACRSEKALAMMLRQRMSRGNRKRIAL